MGGHEVRRQPPAPTISSVLASGRERSREPRAESAAVLRYVSSVPSMRASGAVRPVEQQVHRLHAGAGIGEPGVAGKHGHELDAELAVWAPRRQTEERLVGAVRTEDGAADYGRRAAVPGLERADELEVRSSSGDVRAVDDRQVRQTVRCGHGGAWQIDRGVSTAQNW